MRPFRVGDRVTVHNFSLQQQKRLRGRVICNNRVNKYGLKIMVLVELKGGQEVIESFQEDGKRYGANDKCTITLGWHETEDKS